MLSWNTGSRSRSESCRPINSRRRLRRHRHRARRRVHAFQLDRQPLVVLQRPGSTPPACRPAAGHADAPNLRRPLVQPPDAHAHRAPSAVEKVQAISTPGCTLPACTFQPRRRRQPADQLPGLDDRMRPVLDQDLGDRLGHARRRGRVQRLGQQPPPVFQPPPVQVRGHAPAARPSDLRSTCSSHVAVAATPRAGSGQPRLS